MAEMHHIVPEFFLRRFADERGQIELVPRQGGEGSFTTSVRRAAKEGDFYAAEPNPEVGITEDLVRYVEECLGMLETKVAGLLDPLLSGPFPPESDENRFYIALFVAVQKVRGWAWREDVERMGDYLAKAHIQMEIEHDPQSPFQELARDLDRFVITPGKNFRLGLMLHAALTYAPLLFKMTWRLYEFDEPCLLTSDEPVGIWVPPGDTDPAGFLNANATYMPLDPQHTLALLPRPCAEERRSGTSRRAQNINDATAHSARKWIFQRPGSQVADGVELRPVPAIQKDFVEQTELPDGTIKELHVIRRT